MKKTLTSGITFDASAKTVVHADFSDITIKGIFLITNVTDQTIIYNFADTNKGGVLSTDTLTLEYDTTSMSDTDDIQAIVDDGVLPQLDALTDAELRAAAVLVSGTFWQATQPISGTVTATQGTATNLKAQAETYQGGSAVASGNPLEVNLRSSTVGVATSAKQPALGTAGSSSTDVISVQGIGSGTALPISVASIPSHAVTNAGTFAVQEADGANTTLGAKADAKSTATDTTSITVMQVLKQVSESLQIANPPTLTKSWSSSATTSSGIITTFATAQTESDGTAFTAWELEIASDGAAAAYILLNAISKSPTTSSAGADTMTLTGHGLGTTTVWPVVFTSVSFTSSPTLSTNTTIYYIKGTDANTLKVYTDSGATSLVDITSAAASAFYVAPGPSRTFTYMPATPSVFPVNSYKATPTVYVASAGAKITVSLRGA